MKCINSSHKGIKDVFKFSVIGIIMVIIPNRVTLLPVLLPHIFVNSCFI